MTWAGILVLVAGAYGFKLAGVVIGRVALARNGRESAGEASSKAGSASTGIVERLGWLLPPALLSALVVSQTVTTGTELVVDARLAGVSAGAAAVALKAPFWVVILLAAAVTAGVRFVAG